MATEDELAETIRMLEDRMVRVYGHTGVMYEVPVVDTGHARNSFESGEWFMDPGAGARVFRDHPPELTTRSVASLFDAERIIEDTARRLNHMTPLIPVEFEQMPPKEHRIEEMNFNVRVGGVIHRMPASIAWMDGIGDDGDPDPSDLNVDMADEGKCPTLMELDAPRRRTRIQDLVQFDVPAHADDRVDALVHAYRAITGG